MTDRQDQRLSAAEVAAYRERGYVIPAFRLAAERVAELQAALAALIAANPGVRQESLRCAHLVDNNPDGIRGHRAFLDLALDPQILDAVEQLIGPDIVFWGCQVFCKPGGSGLAVPWHQDGQFWPIRPLATCTAWIALDRVAPDNGCMRVIPGSHRARTIYRHHENRSERLALVQELDADQFDESAAADIALEPGQMSLHDIYMVHGSAANTSGRRRAGVAIRYMPSSSLFDHGLKARPDDARSANFADRPIWLARGVDRHGGNDFTVGQ